MIVNNDFDVKIESYRKQLMRRALRLCNGDYATAEDMVQETMLKAFINKHRFGGSNLRAWMMKILQNCCISSFRRKSRIKNDDCCIADIVAKPNISLEISDELQEAMNRLSPECRRILIESANGMPCNDIAKIFGIPVGTVMSRLFRARKFIQKNLVNYK
ncbi:MAG: RNA polymerase sigma factor [Nitrososphaerales archaeon]